MTKDGFCGVVQQDLYAALYSLCQLWFYRENASCLDTTQLMLTLWGADY
jgi:hypothetical protein